MVHPSLPVHSVAELIAYAKANPGKINYAFVPGTVGHITTELFAQDRRHRLTNIPYKGNGDAIGDLIGGHVSMMVLVDRCRSSATSRRARCARSR